MLGVHIHAVDKLLKENELVGVLAQRSGMQPRLDASPCCQVLAARVPTDLHLLVSSTQRQDCVKALF